MVGTASPFLGGVVQGLYCCPPHTPLFIGGSGVAAVDVPTYFLLCFVFPPPLPPPLVLSRETSSVVLVVDAHLSSVAPYREKEFEIGLQWGHVSCRAFAAAFFWPERLACHHHPDFGDVTSGLLTRTALPQRTLTGTEHASIQQMFVSWHIEGESFTGKLRTLCIGHLMEKIN